MAITKETREQIKVRNAVEHAREEEAAKNVTINNAMTNTAILEEFDLAELEQVDVRHKNVGASARGIGCMSIVNHEHCGRRVHLVNDIWRKLGCPQFLKVFLKPKKIIVMAGADNGIAVKFDRSMKFEDAVKNYRGKIILYATETVKRVTADWKLEFDSNCCYTGGTYKKCTVNGIPAIVISKDESEEVTEPENTTEDTVEENATTEEI